MYHKLKNVVIPEAVIRGFLKNYENIEKAVLKNFAIFTGKQLRWSLFSIELQA